MRNLQLVVEVDTTDESREEFAEMWPRPLYRLKALAEMGGRR